jgi:hypothetical protein
VILGTGVVEKEIRRRDSLLNNVIHNIVESSIVLLAQDLLGRSVGRFDAGKSHQKDASRKENNETEATLLISPETTGKG